MKVENEAGVECQPVAACAVSTARERVPPVGLLFARRDPCPDRAREGSGHTGRSGAELFLASQGAAKVGLSLDPFRQSA